MTKYIFTFYLILTFPFLISAQDTSEVPVQPSELEQLIIDIQSSYTFIHVGRTDWTVLF